MVNTAFAKVSGIGRPAFVGPALLERSGTRNPSRRRGIRRATPMDASRQR